MCLVARPFSKVLVKTDRLVPSTMRSRQLLRLGMDWRICPFHELTDGKIMSPRTSPLRESVFQSSVIGMETSGIHPQGSVRHCRAVSRHDHVKGFSKNARRRNRRCWLHPRRHQGGCICGIHMLKNNIHMCTLCRHWLAHFAL